MTDARTRHGRGLAVVIVLAVVFFALLSMIVLRAGRKKQTVDERPVETLTVLPIRIRVRTEPHARAAVVAQAKSGDRLKLLEDRGSWVRVETKEGLSGWAERASLERTAERQRRLLRYQKIRHLPPLKGAVTEDAQLYAGPGIFYPLVGQLNDESDVVVYTRDHDFYAIDYNNSVAYASVDAIDVSGIGTRQLEVQPTSATATSTETTETAPPVAETTAPPPLETTEAPEPEAPPGGVYAAVPPGGTQPEEIDRVIPRYPGGARRAGIQGPVVVRGIVRRDGTIDNVEIIRDLPHGLGESARQAVSRWRFRPATYRGEPIDVYYTVTVNFRLQ